MSPSWKPSSPSFSGSKSYSALQLGCSGANKQEKKRKDENNRQRVTNFSFQTQKCTNQLRFYKKKVTLPSFGTAPCVVHTFYNTALGNKFYILVSSFFPHKLNPVRHQDLAGPLSCPRSWLCLSVSVTSHRSAPAYTQTNSALCGQTIFPLYRVQPAHCWPGSRRLWSLVLIYAPLDQFTGAKKKKNRTRGVVEYGQQLPTLQSRWVKRSCLAFSSRNV